MSGLSAAALKVYADHGAALATHYEAVDAEAVFAPLADLLPPPCTMVDIGAGTGRDAAWFAARGFGVTAVEPTESLRRVGQERAGPPLTWCDDTLPDLPALAGRRFGLVLVNAVWHHLDAAERDAAIARLATLTEPGGQILIALRHGPEMPGQPVAAMEPEDEIARAGRAGLALIAARAAPATQENNRAAGVTWTWLALRPVEGGAA